MKKTARAINRLAATAGTRVVAIAAPKLWLFASEIGLKKGRWNARSGESARASPTTVMTADPSAEVQIEMRVTHEYHQVVSQ